MQPEGGAKGALSEDAAVKRLVSDGDALAVGGKGDGVLTHNRAAAQDGKADVARPAGSGFAVPRAYGVIGKGLTAAGGYGSTKSKGGA